MTRYFLLSAALVVSATLAMNDAATAKSNGGHGSVGHQGSGNRSGGSYHQGEHHDHYRGRDFRNWSRYGWFSRYGCYGYYCGDNSCWYYWYGPRNCYLPVSQIAEYPPTGTAPIIPPAGAIQNVQIQMPSAGPAPTAAPQTIQVR